MGGEERGGGGEEGGEFRDFKWSDAVHRVGKHRGWRTIVVKGQLLWFSGAVSGSGEYVGKGEIGQVLERMGVGKGVRG